MNLNKIHDKKMKSYNTPVILNRVKIENIVYNTKFYTKILI